MRRLQDVALALIVAAAIAALIVLVFMPERSGGYSAHAQYAPSSFHLSRHWKGFE